MTRATLRVPVKGTDCSVTVKPLACRSPPRYSAARRSSGVALRRGPIVSARWRTVTTEFAASNFATASWSYVCGGAAAAVPANRPVVTMAAAVATRFACFMDPPCVDRAPQNQTFRTPWQLPLPVGLTIAVLAALLVLAALVWARMVDRRRRPRPGPMKAPPRFRERPREPDRVR